MTLTKHGKRRRAASNRDVRAICGAGLRSDPIVVHFLDNDEDGLSTALTMTTDEAVSLANRLLSAVQWRRDAEKREGEP